MSPTDFIQFNQYYVIISMKCENNKGCKVKPYENKVTNKTQNK